MYYNKEKLHIMCREIDLQLHKLHKQLHYSFEDDARYIIQDIKHLQEKKEHIIRHIYNLDSFEVRISVSEQKRIDRDKKLKRILDGTSL